MAPEKSTKGLSFDAFVEGYLADPQPEFANVGSQGRFLVPERGPGADRLFRYDDMASFVRFLEDRLDCEITLPRLSVSPPGATDLSPAIETRLRDAFGRDFALYASLGR